MAADLTQLLDDLSAETDEVAVMATDLAAPTPATPWTVGDTVGHLWFFDLQARLAAEDPDAFSVGLNELIADMDGYMARAVSSAAALGDRIVDEWLTERAGLIAVLRVTDPSARLAWYGPPMSPASSATARLMETWAHGQDIADGLGIVRAPTDRLRHICFLGFRTRGFSYSVRGLAVPDGEVFVSLTPPSGGAPWTFGSPDATDSITGTALDFCLLVTQRRLLADLSLTVTGPLAVEWASHAQIFAGMPTTTDPLRRGLSIG